MPFGYPARQLAAAVLAGALLLAGVPAAAQTPAAAPLPAPAAEPAADPALGLAEAGHLLALDARAVLGAPLGWNAGDWGRFGLVTLGVGAVALADRSVRDRERRDHSPTADDVARVAEPFGAGVSFGVVGGFYLGGLVAGDERARDAGFDGAVASLLASGVITPIAKEIAGRSRPSQSAKTFDFHPFSGRASFPSGHATQAFAVASVLATSYDSRWVAAGSYGVAVLVGFARIHHQAHFVSDVAASAAIGTAVGRTVVLTNRRDRRRLPSVALAPLTGPHDRPGLVLVARW